MKLATSLILLTLMSCDLTAFCINGRYDYSYDYLYVWDYNYGFHDYTVRSYSTVMMLDLDTGKLLTRNVDQVQIGDYVLSHNGYFTYVTNVTLTTIANPQLFYRRGIVNEYDEPYTQVGLDIKPEYENVIFTDSDPNVFNRTVGEYFPNSYASAYQFGLSNITNNIAYDIYYADGYLNYYMGGVRIINMAEVLNYISAQNITSFSYTSITYYNIEAAISACDAVEITTEIGTLMVNGLSFNCLAS